MGRGATTARGFAAHLARGRGPRCIPRPELSRPGTHDEKRSASRHLTNRAPIGCAATACPVASTFRALPRNLAHERSPCTPIRCGCTAAGGNGGNTGGGTGCCYSFARPVAAGTVIAATTEAGPPHREHEGAAFRAASGCRSAHRMAYQPMHARLSGEGARRRGSSRFIAL